MKELENKNYLYRKGYAQGRFDIEMDFIAEAREGWPEAIRRALEAESKLKEIKLLLDQESFSEHLENVNWYEIKQLEEMIREIVYRKEDE